MPTYLSDLKGTMLAILGVGGATGVAVKHNAGVMEVRSAGDAGFATLRALALETGANLNDVVTLYDILSNGALIEFSFAGASAPDPGDNTTKFGFCHTTGDDFTAGDVVYDDGTELILAPFALRIATTSAITGTVSLIANGIYYKESGAWTGKGDGSGSGVGMVKIIEVPFVFGSTNVNATTPIPDGARLLRQHVRVDTPFNGTAPTVALSIQGSTPLTTLTTTESNLKFANQYTSHTVIPIGSTSAGLPRAAVTSDSSSAGAGVAIWEFTVAPSN